jgi:hypothetical protein
MTAKNVSRLRYLNVSGLYFKVVKIIEMSVSVILDISNGMQPIGNSPRWRAINIHGEFPNNGNYFWTIM